MVWQLWNDRAGKILSPSPMIDNRGLSPSMPWGGDSHLPKPVLLEPAWFQGTPQDLQDGCPGLLGWIPASAAPAHCPAFLPNYTWEWVRAKWSAQIVTTMQRARFSFGHGSYESRSLPHMGQMATITWAGHRPSFLQLLGLGRRNRTSQGHSLCCCNESGQGSEKWFVSGRAVPRVTYFAEHGKLCYICIWAFGWCGILASSCQASALTGSRTA